MHPTKDLVYMDLVHVDREDWKKVAVNLEGLAFSYIPALTSVCILSPSNRDEYDAKQKPWKSNFAQYQYISLKAAHEELRDLPYKLVYDDF